VTRLSEQMKGQALRRPEHRRKDNIAIDVKEFVCEDVDSTNLAQNRDQ
jgi:hypothetical protein